MVPIKWSECWEDHQWDEGSAKRFPKLREYNKLKMEQNGNVFNGKKEQFNDSKAVQRIS